MPQRPVRKIIENRSVLTAPAHATVIEALRLMKQAKTSAVMVVNDDGRLIGVFTEHDAVFRVLADGRNARTTRLAGVMTPKPLTIHPDKPFGHALHMMYEGGFRHVPVVENGRPIGMVSARDALNLDLEAFESELLSRRHIGEILG